MIDVKRRQQGGPTHRGWWHVGLIGPIAATLAACRLHKIDRAPDRDRDRHRELQLRRFPPQHGHDGEGAAFRQCGARRYRGGHAGAAAALPPTPPSSNRRSAFCRRWCCREDRDITAVAERLGRPYVLEGPQRIKRFPACNPGHPLIDAALRLVHEQHVSRRRGRIARGRPAHVLAAAASIPGTKTAPDSAGRS